MNNEITIIIPTYERQTYIRRSLEFWSIYPVNVIVVDGSTTPSVGENLISNFKNIEYFHLPISPEKRIYFATNRINTPYALIISDDEFISYSALITAKDILMSDEQVVAVLGETVAFHMHANKMVGRRLYQSAHQLDISANSPKSRLLQRIKFADNSIFFPLVRADLLRIAGKYMSDNQYSCPYIAEIQMEAILCSAGKVKVISKLMWFRSLEVNRITTPEHDRSISFYAWCNDPKNAEDFKRLLASSNTYLSLASSTSTPITGLEFIDIFSEQEKLTAHPRKQNKWISMRRMCYMKLPITVRKFIRTAFYYLLEKTPEGSIPIELHLNKLANLGIDYDKDEVTRIEKLLSRSVALNGK